MVMIQEQTSPALLQEVGGVHGSGDSGTATVLAGSDGRTLVHQLENDAS